MRTVTFTVDEKVAEAWVETDSSKTTVEMITVLSSLIHGTVKDTFGLYKKAGIFNVKVSEK